MPVNSSYTSSRGRTSQCKTVTIVRRNYGLNTSQHKEVTLSVLKWCAWIEFLIRFSFLLLPSHKEQEKHPPRSHSAAVRKVQLHSAHTDTVYKKEVTYYSFKTIAQTAQPWLIKVVLYKGYTTSLRAVLGAIIEPAICGVWRGYAPLSKHCYEVGVCPDPGWLPSALLQGQ